MWIAMGTSCNSQNNFSKVAEFNDYWYAGDAEITSYDLKQARYGEIHNGTAVLIFVTEDFSNSKQVKLDNPNKNPKDAVSVLKLNANRSFNTGVYDYSIMQSVFTPVNIESLSNTLKVTTSVQDWCGQAFQQMNLKSNDFEFKQFSYFESEGDQVSRLEKHLLEEELFNRIRINPASLPIGSIKIIPSSLFVRLQHKDLKVESAIASLEEQDEFNVYTVKYSNVQRSVKIKYKNTFPFEILSWEEDVIRGYGANARKLTTIATKKKTLKIPYWEKNGSKDVYLRNELGL
jgi:hypothetical protein